MGRVPLKETTEKKLVPVLLEDLVLLRGLGSNPGRQGSLAPSKVPAGAAGEFPKGGRFSFTRTCNACPFDVFFSSSAGASGLQLHFVLPVAFVVYIYISVIV